MAWRRSSLTNKPDATWRSMILGVADAGLANSQHSHSASSASSASHAAFIHPAFPLGVRRAVLLDDVPDMAQTAQATRSVEVCVNELIALENGARLCMRAARFPYRPY